MQHVQYAVIGAGISGLSFAALCGSDSVAVLEADQHIGGYCRTIERDGFVWDYSGHFFHFKHPDVEAWLRRHMPDDEVRTVQRDSRIHFADRLIDFPFQKNIHQLPQDDFIDCLYELHFRHETFPADQPAADFHAMLLQKFGRGIADRFLIPYNEKLYACDLRTLDVNAMGRFFPWADEDEIIRNFRRPDNSSYNASFTYPRRGAIRYVEAIARQLPPDTIHAGERVTAIDLERRTLTTTRRALSWEHLISSAPLPRLLEMTGEPAPAGMLAGNRVLVFNLGFDRKGPEGVHWIYYPQRDVRFYRIGFYDNIFGTDRMSMYVEIGLPAEGPVDVSAERARVLADLRRVGVVTDHVVVAEHHVLLDPAYVHITEQSQRFTDVTRDRLAAHGAHTIGRYGGWTYCSIEDNILEARALAARLRGDEVPLP